MSVCAHVLSLLTGSPGGQAQAYVQCVAGCMLCTSCFIDVVSQVGVTLYPKCLRGCYAVDGTAEVALCERCRAGAGCVLQAALAFGGMLGRPLGCACCAAPALVRCLGDRGWQKGCPSFDVWVMQACTQPARCALKLSSSKLCPRVCELSSVVFWAYSFVLDAGVASLSFPIALLHTVCVVDAGRCSCAFAWNCQGVRFLHGLLCCLWLCSPGLW